MSIVYTTRSNLFPQLNLMSLTLQPIKAAIGLEALLDTPGKGLLGLFLPLVPQRKPKRTLITQHSRVVARIARTRQQHLEVVGVQHIPRPHKDRNARVGPKSRSQVGKGVAGNVHVAGR